MISFLLRSSAPGGALFFAILQFDLSKVIVFFSEILTKVICLKVLVRTYTIVGLC